MSFPTGFGFRPYFRGVRERRAPGEEEPMSSVGSVTHWIHQLKQGDRDAARPLWERYFRALVERARRQLGSLPRRVADEEDVALAAFNSFYRAAEQGRFPKLDDRDDLWQVLLRIVTNKAIDERRRVLRPRRGGGRVLDEGALPVEDPAGDGSPLALAMSREPSPEFAALAAEEWRRLFGLLRDPELEKVALMKMEGYGMDEIAGQLGCVPRTVQRKLQLIRHTWEQGESP
jgi:DNA-directed RNA polymerase specialized sigma24 family protein